MGLYDSKAQAPKETGGSWGPGAYKFKIVEAKLHSKGAVRYKMETQTEDGGKGPNVWDWLNINSEKQGALDEVDRRLFVMTGAMKLEKAEDLINKWGWVVLWHDGQYLTTVPFGGYYDKNKKSATGKDSIEERVAEAIKKSKTEGDVQKKAAPVATETEDDESLPF